MPIVSNLAGINVPDVYVTELEPPVQILGRGTGVIGFVGQFTRGDLNTPVLVSDPSDLIRKFGDFKDGLDGYITAFLAMQQGASQLKIVRVADAGCVAASAQISGATGATHLFSVVARSVGSWGNTLYYRITNSTTSGYVDVEFKFGDEVTIYKQVNFDSADTDNYLITKVNQDTNRIVNLTRVASANVTTLPDEATSYTALAGGDDGTSEGSSLGDAYYVGADAASGKSGLECFTADNDVNIIFSARSSTTINAALVSQATNTALTPRMAVLSFAYGTSIADAKSAMTSINTDFAAITYPHIKIFNPNTSAEEYWNPSAKLAGELSVMSPEQSPSRHQLKGLIGIERRLTMAEVSDLIAYRIIPIYTKPNVGFIFGAGITTSSNGGKRQIVRRRMVNYLSIALEAGLQPFVSRPHTSALRQEVATAINGLLERELRDNRIGNANGGKAYFVKCDASNNPASVVQANRLVVDVQVSLLAPADLVIVKLDASEEKTIVSA